MVINREITGEIKRALANIIGKEIKDELMKIKAAANVTSIKLKNVIRNHFNYDFSKFRKHCKFLHICRDFVLGILHVQ